MKKNRIEPGILQVFRIFALLHIGLVVLSLISSGFNISFRPANVHINPGATNPNQPQLFEAGPIIATGQSQPGLFTLIVFIEMGILLVYLTIPWFQKKLGRWFLPVGLVFAGACLISEPLISFPFGQAWSAEPFLYLLVIMIAWQYDFIWVLAFAVVTIVVDIYTGPQEFVLRGLTDNPYVTNPLVYLLGKNISRTATFIILGFVVSRLSIAQKRQREALEDANKRLLRHNVTLEQLTVSRERNRLSRELHDTLAHTLSALTVQLEAVITIWEKTPKKARSMLDALLETTRSGLDETRRALHSLRASPLDDMGLSLAINAFAEDCAARYGLKYQGQLDEHLGTFTPEIEQCFYRVAQEALENAGQHANGKSISVHLCKEEGKLILEISDDGTGLPKDLSDKKQRLGIKGMRERAENIQAELNIESQPGYGTTIRLEKDLPA